MRPDHQCDQDQNQSLHDHTFMEKKKNLPALEPGFAALLKIHPVLAPRCNQYGLTVTVDRDDSDHDDDDGDHDDLDDLNGLDDNGNDDYDDIDIMP